MMLDMEDSLGTKYDDPHVGLVPNDMVDNSMERTFSYSDGDQDVREYKFMLRKFSRLQDIIDSIHNGPVSAAEPEEPRGREPPPEEPDCTVPGPDGAPQPGCPAPPKPGQPFLSYTQRIVKMLAGIQERINAAAKRQYVIEDEVRGPLDEDI